jgi:phage-related protein (TIGR01555 family)
MSSPAAPVLPPEPTLLSPVRAAASKFARRLDGWVNTVTGLGGLTTDRAASSRFEAGSIPDALAIDTIYTHDWLADRIIEKMPSIALVRGFAVEGAGSNADELIRDFEALNTSERFPGGAFQKAIYDGRAYGCAGLFLGYRDGNPVVPVSPATAKRGLAFLDVVAQHELKVVSRFTNPSDPQFGMPEIYEILGTSNGIPHPRRGQRFHSSRLLRFLGKPLRTGQHPLGNYPELGVSVLTNVLADIARYGTSWAAISHLLQDASIGVMKMGGLVEALASEDSQIIQDRLSVLQRTKSLNRLMFLDADAGEEFSRVAVSFADLPGVMAQIILSISGAADMPAKILFGTSPMGLNANSAGIADLEQFYNSVDEYRRRTIGPKLETVLRAISGNADVRVKFPALWQPSENEQAQTRLTNANATQAYWNMGAVQAKDVIKAQKEGVQPETIGTVSDEREPDPVGESAGADPQGAPGAKLAAALANSERSDA